MFSRAMAILGVALLVSMPTYAFAGKTVIMKDTDKTSKIKVGDTLDIQIPNAAAKDLKKDFKVDAKGTALDKATISEETRKGADGKPLSDGRYESIKMKALAKGTEKVTVTWQCSGKTEKKDFDITVE